MASTLKVNTIQGASNTATTIKTNGGTDAITINTSGNVGIGESDISSFGGVYRGLDIAYKGSGLAGRTNNPTFDMRSNVYYDGSNYKYGEGSTSAGILSVGGNQLIFSNAPNGTAGATATVTEMVRINGDGHILVGTTTAGLSGTNSEEHVVIENDGEIKVQGAAKAVGTFNRNLNDGTILLFQQQNTSEGSIGVSGNTVSFDGFAGRHESSGIPTDTEKGTVVSTIDELDKYPAKQGEGKNEEDCPKAGQDRADHAKVKISDSVGDKRVYGVVDNYTSQGKLMVASVGIASVKVTGACKGGDLLESNGDGTAKVQSDDIIRSKTLGKVTIGNSNTDVKLVSCVLYCG